VSGQQGQRLRNAAPHDGPAIRALLETAFPTAAEVDLVEALADDGDLRVALVAEEDGEIVGFIALSRMEVSADGGPVEALGLAPVAVRPDVQGCGIGSTLIKAAIEGARRQGAALVFVLGAPDYYGRFGFTARAAAPFQSPYGGPHLMARWQTESRSVRSGSARYAAAFAGLS
jgi:putative acetyltransferase